MAAARPRLTALATRGAEPPRRARRHSAASARWARWALSGVVVVVTALAVAPSAHASTSIKRTAKTMSDRAAKLFAEKRFRAAAELFEKAYALDGAKVIRLRNAGRAYEEAGAPKLALHCFKRYVALEKSERLLADARERITRLQAAVSGGGGAAVQPKAPAEQSRSKPAPVSPQPAAAATPVPGGQPSAQIAAAAPSARPRWALPLGAAGVGALAGGVSALVLTSKAAARVDAAEARDDYSYPGGSSKLSADRSTITLNRALGWTLVGLGAVGAGVATWAALRGTPGPATGLSLAPVGPGDGAGFSAALRF